MHKIILKNVEIGYKNALTSPIDISIENDDYIVVVGENGSGKTTLIKTILNLIDKISGDIIFENIKRNEIAYLPQSTSVANDFPSTVYEVVLSGCNQSLFPFYSKEEKNKTEKIMKDFNILDLKNKSLSELSGGQKQRVLLSRALVNPKKLLFIDEPANNLDKKSNDELFNILDKINKNGTSIVMISHDKENVYNYATSILRIENKKVTLEKVLKNV